MFMISIQNMSFTYTDSSAYILDSINLTIAKGEYISVVGENGSGKTTLMRLLLRFLKPTNGSIEVAAKKIGYVPQKKDFTNADFPITVYEAMDSYRKIMKIKDRAIVEESLAKVGMSAFKDALMGTLSGGQSQKIFIARALMGDPALLILDEPSTGIDRTSQAEIYKLLKQINTEKGITIVSVEHNLDAAISNSTLIYHLLSGKGHLCTPQKYTEEYLNVKKRGAYSA
jgi:zinc transport system ATP-binding protein